MAGALAAVGLGGAGTLFSSNDPKHAAWLLFVAALGAFLKGLFAQDVQKTPPAETPGMGE